MAKAEALALMVLATASDSPRLLRVDTAWSMMFQLTTLSVRFAAIATRRFPYPLNDQASGARRPPGRFGAKEDYSLTARYALRITTQGSSCLIGDPVITTGTNRHVENGNGWSNWNLSYEQYKKCSAL